MKTSAHDTTNSQIVMHCVTYAADGSLNKKDLMDRICAVKAEDPELPYDVKLSVNGVDLDFRSFERRLIEAHDEEIKHAAAQRYEQIFNEKIFDLMHGLGDLARQLKDAMRQEITKITGYDRWQEDE